MTNWIRYSENVLFPEITEKYVTVLGEDIEKLGQDIETDHGKTYRVCAHRSHDSQIHEMFVSHSAGTVIPPHKRSEGSESYLMIRGEMLIIFYDDNGVIDHFIKLDSKGHDSVRYVRLEEPLFRGIHIVVDSIFLEVKLGPFENESVVWANWGTETDLLNRVRDDSVMLFESGA